MEWYFSDPLSTPLPGQVPPRGDENTAAFTPRGGESVHARLVVPALLIASLLVAPTLTSGAPRTSWDAKACGRVGGTLVFGQAQDTVSLDPNVR
mgnify:CR=1 FL=1